MKRGMLVTIIALLLLAACGAPAAQQPAPSPAQEPTPAPEQSCASEDCFILAANNCEELTVTIPGAAGTFRYASSKDCVLTKTFMTAAPDEQPEVKALLEGKSMTCKYEKEKFDSRLVTGLVFGSENCQGPLKDALAQLLIFA